jgi:hypothetical protein
MLIVARTEWQREPIALKNVTLRPHPPQAIDSADRQKIKRFCRRRIAARWRRNVPKRKSNLRGLAAVRRPASNPCSQ